MHMLLYVYTIKCSRPGGDAVLSKGDGCSQHQRIAVSELEPRFTPELPTFK